MNLRGHRPRLQTGSSYPGGHGPVKPLSFKQLVDWENTRAYAEQPYGQVFITIDRGDERYTRVRQELAERLRLFTDPETGEKVMSRVYMKEELFQMPYNR